MGIGHEICMIPVMVGRHARQYTCMTEAGWRELMRGNEHKFTVNKVLNQLGDLRLTGEINCFHNYMEEKSSLDQCLREAQHTINKLMKKALEADQALGESKMGLEMGLKMTNTHHEIHNKFHLTFGGPMLRSLPWWVLRGAGLCLSSIRIGLSHCCLTGLVSRSCGYAYSSCVVLLCLTTRHGLH